MHLQSLESQALFGLWIMARIFEQTDAISTPGRQVNAATSFESIDIANCCDLISGTVVIVVVVVSVVVV